MTLGQSRYRVVVTTAFTFTATGAVEASRLYHDGLAHLQAGQLAKAELSFRQAIAINAGREPQASCSSSAVIG